MATALITGGAGFIGSHLLTRLSSLGFTKITVIDSLEFGSKNNLSLKDQETQSVIELVERNLVDISDNEYLTYLEGVDFVFHLAAEKHNQSIGRPQDVLDANVTAMCRLLEACTKTDVKKVVFSSSLYANGQTSELNRITDIPNPSTIYGVSKLAGEGLLRHYHLQHGLDFACFRFYFVYGPKQYEGLGYKSVIVKNFQKLLNGEAPTIFGSGEQTLDYVFVDDIVDLLILSLSAPSSAKIFNASRGQEVSINMLTQNMLEIAGSNLEPIYKDPDWTEGTRRYGSSAETYEHFSWKPSTSIKEGLTQTFNWLKHEHK